MSNMKFDTAVIKFAQPEDFPVLKLYTAGRANRAHLEQDANGRLSLYFRGLHYRVDDYVPNALFGIRSICQASALVNSYVGRCSGTMGTKKTSRQRWPASS